MKPEVEIIGVKAAGDSFSLLVDRVFTGREEFLVTRRTTPAASIIHPATLAELRQFSPHPGGGAHVCSCGRMVQP